MILVSFIRDGIVTCIMEICAVGGYNEVGRNMTAVRIDGQVIILDMGFHLPNLIAMQESAEEFTRVSELSLRRAGAVPDDRAIKDWHDEVAAIVVGHAHLDHLGATPYLARKYNAPILCTPFTAEVLKSIVKSERINLENAIIEIRPSGKWKLPGSIEVEFVRVTHSTPQTVMIVLHTKQGVIAYGNDYKLDDTPTLGKPPDYARMKKLGERGVSVLIQDCLYAREDAHCPSEKVARDELVEVMQACDPRKAMIVTTFSSHIARLKAIGQTARKLKRQVLFMGRSMARYGWAAKDANVTDLGKLGRLVKYARQIRAKLREVQRKGPEKYVLVVSGHQGEPQSTLAKMLDGTYAWDFREGDAVIFSSHVIPVDINQQARSEMDGKLKERGVKIYDDVHVSGHAFLKDLDHVLDLLKPKQVIPTHAELETVKAFSKMAKRHGYKKGKSLHVLKEGDRITLE